MVAFRVNWRQGRFREGDVILVSTKERPVDGDWVVVRRGDCLLCEAWSRAGEIIGVIIGIMRDGSIEPRAPIASQQIHA